LNRIPRPLVLAAGLALAALSPAGCGPREVGSITLPDDVMQQIERAHNPNLVPMAKAKAVSRPAPAPPKDRP
jgi:hypothetical protein